MSKMLVLIIAALAVAVCLGIGASANHFASNNPPAITLKRTA